MNYICLPSLTLPEHLYKQLNDLDWQELDLTTELTKWTVLKFLLKNPRDAIDYLRFYGLLLQQVGTLKNFLLPKKLETEISEYVHSKFSVAAAPILRLQVLYGGSIAPLHTDATREASLVFEVRNHQGSNTTFYQSDAANAGLVNPTKCQFDNSLIITQPTMLNTKQVHAVVYDYGRYTKYNPRVSLTAKWANVGYQTLIDNLK